jgi:hypothetical protein
LSNIPRRYNREGSYKEALEGESGYHFVNGIDMILKVIKV